MERDKIRFAVFVAAAHRVGGRVLEEVRVIVTVKCCR